MATIHPTALVDAQAQLANNVEIGAYTIIGAHVAIDSGTSIGSHCVVEGFTTIGQNNHIYSHNVIGGAPQDKKYAGEPTRLEIGNGNTIREFCTINTGTVQDSGCTRLGDDNWIMSSVHIAHDVQVANHTILASYVGLAGHVHLEEYAIIGGQSGVHQFCRVGAHAMLGSNSVVNQDIPPFVLVDGNPGKPRSFNVEGLRRRGFSPERIAAIKAMYKLLYRDNLSLENASVAIKNITESYPQAVDDIEHMLTFLGNSKRGMVR